MAIFQLSHATYDSQTDYFFEVPEGVTPDQFQNQCDTLMREEVRRIMADPACRSHRIGYEDLVSEIATRLPELGYRRVRFPRITYLHGLQLRRTSDDGAEQVLGDELADAVYTHNDRAMENRYGQYEK